MYEKIYFDLAAAVILFTMILSLQLRQMTKGLSNKMFLNLTWCCFVTALLDILRFVFEGDVNISRWVSISATILFYIFRNLSFAAYCFYIISITDMWHKARTKVQLIIMPIPFIVTALFAFSSIFSNVPFYFDNHGFFVMGKGAWLFYLCNEVYVIYAVVSIFAYRFFLGKRKTIALFSTVVASLLAYLISQRYPQFHMDMIFYSLGILFVMIVVQNPEVRIDYQSGLARHATYHEELFRAFASEKPMTVIMINIRNFKEISRLLSYSKVTAFVKYLGSRMQIINDKLKLNGELYYIKDGKYRLVAPALSEELIDKAGETFNNLFNTEVQLDDISIDITSLVCIAKCPENFNDIEVFQDFDDTIMDFDNQNKVVRATEVLANDDYNIVHRMDSIIENGILNNGFEVYYQPIYNVKTEKFDTAEALLRLYDKRYGFIYPSLFIPAAEKNGSIHRLGELVINQVCKFVSSTEFDNLSLEYISINISVFQCLKADFPNKVIEIINRYGINPTKLCFEIRESLATDSQKVFLDNIEILKDFGIKFALDDYGTGYSNVTTFSNTSLQVIKLDKSFTNPEKNERLNAVLEYTINMVKSLGKSIVIEGVEKKEDLDRFIEYGCDKIQGFIYSNAIPEDEYIEFLKANN